MIDDDFKSMPDEKLIEQACIRAQSSEIHVKASVELNRRRKRKEALMIYLTIAILFLTIIILGFTIAQFYNAPVVIIPQPIDTMKQPNNQPHQDGINQKKDGIKK